MNNIAKSPRQVVASGNYVIEKKQDLILDAYLGTCVGVTLCDREAQIGGLAHFLLPEWIGFHTPWKAKAYARTGFPIFMDELCKAGAEEKRMEACIAGGALVGPISKFDLDLDIGGRTEEILLSSLKEKNIPIVQAETGGYLSCRLSLDLEGFNSFIEPISASLDQKADWSKKQPPEDITNLFSQIRPIPQICLKILRMVNDDSYKMTEISEEIKKDQVISASVIRLCNSTFIGMKRKIDSIERALIMLGEKHLLLMVISASLELYFKDLEHGYSLCKGGLFQHALGVALIAERLAVFTGRVSPKIAYTAGLLHDIGKVILDQFLAPVHSFFYRKIQVEGLDLCDVEKEKFGYSHSHIGKILAEKWSLPENLIDAIRYHHFPEQAAVDAELVHLVYFADLLMSRFQVGYTLSGSNVDRFSSRLEKLGLTSAQFPMLVELIPSELLNGLLHGFQLRSLS